MLLLYRVSFIKIQMRLLVSYFLYEENNSFKVDDTNIVIDEVYGTRTSNNTFKLANNGINQHFWKINSNVEGAKR